MSATVPGKTAVVPSWTWGSSARVEIVKATALVPPVNVRRISAQLMQVSLPEPAVCSIYLQASASSLFPFDDYVKSLTINLNEGIGRVTVPRQMTFPTQPAPGAPLELTIPFVPVHALNVDMTVDVVLNNLSPDSRVEVECYMILSPLTRIQQKQQELSFGMGLPGEADDLDDELRSELEAEGPSVAQMMGEGRQHVDGSSPEEPADEPDEPQVTQAPPWLLALVDALTERYGRPPSRAELRAAVERRRARAMRRDQRAR